MERKVKRALISVSDKVGIKEFAQYLTSQSVDIISTGGTAKLLREAGITVRDISDVTEFPEMLDGRVKTLHPKVHGGLLGRRNLESHKKAMQEHDIPEIDMVVVNLYPFEETVAKGASYDEIVENIDIGGPSMIRSAAKNHNDVVVVTDPSDYEVLREEMAANNCGTTLDFRKKLAAKAFARTASYDTHIGNWFAGEQEEIFPETANFSMKKRDTLRYGENPHQKAALYVSGKDSVFGVATARQLQGKELSYNNIADTDAAFELVSEFTKPAVAIIKHANPCGVATADNIADAYQNALASDPVSAYGSIIALNQTVDESVAILMKQLFVEVIIAPDIDDAARKILSAKKNLRLLVTDEMPDSARMDMMLKAVTGGILMQERDHINVTAEDLQVVTKRAPTEREIQDMLFAFRVCKHVKSNAIVLAKDGMTTGVGAGQMSRVDSVRIAIDKTKQTAENVEDATGSVIASDAFFPFADGLVLAAEAGVTAAIHPGGSKRDEEVIAAADEHNMAMVVTGTRHFRH